MKESIALVRCAQNQARNPVALLLAFALAAFGLVLLAKPSAAAPSPKCSARYQIDKLMKNGARWQMCWEIRPTEGLSLSNVIYTPRGGKAQLVLASARLAALYVPYDTGVPRYDDMNELGLVERLVAKDCPGGKVLKDNEGAPVVCTTTRSRGHAHRNNYSPDGDEPRVKALQGDQFEVFAINQIGWYSYLDQWTFFDDGTIKPQLGATGSLTPETIRDPKYGWPVGVRAKTFSPNHSHIAFWRLDFDVAGPKNDVVQQFDFTGSGTPKRLMKKTALTRESARTVAPMRWWRVVDTVTKNADGHPVSWEVLPDNSALYRGPARTEPWTHSDIYVSHYRWCEQLVTANAAGNCPRTVTKYINDERLDDPIVWAGVSFHHVPRDEDEDPMPMHWQGLTITPRDVTSKSPLPQGQ